MSKPETKRLFVVLPVALLDSLAIIAKAKEIAPQIELREVATLFAKQGIIHTDPDASLDLLDGPTRRACVTLVSDIYSNFVKRCANKNLDQTDVMRRLLLAHVSNQSAYLNANIPPPKVRRGRPIEPHSVRAERLKAAKHRVMRLDGDGQLHAKLPVHVIAEVNRVLPFADLTFPQVLRRIIDSYTRRLHAGRAISPPRIPPTRRFKPKMASVTASINLQILAEFESFCATQEAGLDGILRQQVDMWCARQRYEHGLSSPKPHAYPAISRRRKRSKPPE